MPRKLKIDLGDFAKGTERAAQAAAGGPVEVEYNFAGKTVRVKVELGSSVEEIRRKLGEKMSG